MIDIDPVLFLGFSIKPLASKKCGLYRFHTGTISELALAGSGLVSAQLGSIPPFTLESAKRVGSHNY